MTSLKFFYFIIFLQRIPISFHRKIVLFTGINFTLEQLAELTLNKCVEKENKLSWSEMNRKNKISPF